MQVDILCQDIYNNKVSLVGQDKGQKLCRAEGILIQKSWYGNGLEALLVAYIFWWAATLWLHLNATPREMKEQTICVLPTLCRVPSPTHWAVLSQVHGHIRAVGGGAIGWIRTLPTHLVDDGTRSDQRAWQPVVSMGWWYIRDWVCPEGLFLGQPHTLWLPELLGLPALVIVTKPFCLILTHPK